MVSFVDLPTEIHARIAARLIIDGCCPSDQVRDYAMVLPLARVSIYWAEVVLSAFKQAERDIEPQIELFVARSRPARRGDTDRVYMIRLIMRRALKETLADLKTQVIFGRKESPFACEKKRLEITQDFRKAVYEQKCNTVYGFPRCFWSPYQYLPFRRLSKPVDRR